MIGNSSGHSSLPYLILGFLLLVLSGLIFLLYRAIQNKESFYSVFALTLICGVLSIVLIFGLLRADDKSRARLSRFADEIRWSREELAMMLEREKELRRETEKLSRDKDKFISLVSHQIRTPLNAIQGWVTILAHSDTPEKIKARAFRRIEENVFTQSQALDDLIMLSDLNSGNIQLQTSVVNSAKMIEKVVDEAAPKAKNQEIKILVDNRLVSEEVDCDELVVATALSRLIDSILSRTKKGGKLKFLAFADVGYMQFQIADDKPTESGLALSEPSKGDIGAGKNGEYGDLALGVAVSRQMLTLCGAELDKSKDSESPSTVWTARLPLIQ